MTTIPDAAIEAAAEGLWDHRELHMAGKGYECYCGERVYEGYAIAPSKVAHGKHLARAAIEAAMPAIREAIAQEIEASKATQRVATDHEPRWSAGACKCGAPLGDGIDLHWHMVNQTIDHAARIVRGGTP